MLPISWAGVLLMILAAIFFAAEAFVVSHGALTVAGAVSFVFGALILFDPAGPNYQVSVWVALAIALSISAFMFFVAAKLVQARRRPPETGESLLVGALAVVDRDGWVHRERRALAGDHGGRPARSGPATRSGSSASTASRSPSSTRRSASRSHRIPVVTALIVVAAVAVLVILFLTAAIKVAREYERGVIFRLGRLLPEPKGPGVFLLIPIIDRMVKVDLRTITLNVPPQEVITKDNVPVRVNAVAYFRIVDPKAAIVQIENFMVATSQISQTTLRSVLGQHLLDELLSERDKINAILQQIIDEPDRALGVKVTIVEVKDVEIPAGMQRAMARQAEAERERRAKVIAAEGEFQASERLKDAANVMEEAPIALQLRYLQTLLEIGATELDDHRVPGADRPHPPVPRGPGIERQRATRAPPERAPARPALGRLVVVAPDRARRPGAGAARDRRADADELEECPFCEGREDRTPPEVLALGRATGTRRAGLAGARRPQPLPGVRAPGGRRPRARACPLVRGARRRAGRGRRRGVAAAGGRRSGGRPRLPARARQRGPRRRREPGALALAARLARRRAARGGRRDRRRGAARGARRPRGGRARRRDRARPRGGASSLRVGDPAARTHRSRRCCSCSATSCAGCAPWRGPCRGTRGSTRATSSWCRG